MGVHRMVHAASADFVCALLLFGVILNGVVTLQLPGIQQRNKLLYIMIDGFRYDYVDAQSPEALPGFSKFLQNGARVEYLNPIFPSISYPDWQTLATGLWAESHGIVGNYMYDAEDNDTFMLFDADSTGKSKWWTAEPVWTTATKAGVETAAVFWSRCDIPFDGVVPHYCEPFITIPGLEIFRKNIDTALMQLEQGSDFALLYTDYIDHAGHDLGPETDEMKTAIRNIDHEIEYMLKQISDKRLNDILNIIIVSDHGMMDTALDKINRVELDDYLIPEYVQVILEAIAFSNIKVIPGHLDEVYAKLETMPGVDVYKHSDIPDELHFRDNKRIYDILLKAHPDTFIMHSRSQAQIPPRNDNYTYYGAHGWSSREVPQLRGIVFASGPDFKTNGTITPAVEIVDVYSLVCHVLNIQPLPNNGTFERIKPMLKEESLTTSTEAYMRLSTMSRSGMNGARSIEVAIWLCWMVFGLAMIH